MNGLTAVIISRDEEQNLPRCLQSLAFADEIIVVDSQSVDRSVEIAREHGARVLSPPWRGFGPAKQYGVERARGQWVLSIDADEVVQPALAEEIRTVISRRAAHSGYYIPRRTEFLGRWILHSGWYPDPVLRLFRKDSGSFTDALVHEKVELQGSTGHLKNDLLHYSYPSLESYFDKFNRYTSLAAKEARDLGRRATLYDIVIRPVAKFVKQYILRRGFLDGPEGFVLAVLSSCYVLVKYAKLRHLEQQGPIPEVTMSETDDTDRQVKRW